MPTVFLDESGHFAVSDFFCLAGYMADDSTWKAFSADWKFLLSKHNLPELHMKQIMSPRGNSPAAAWEMPRKLEMLSEFITVIRRYVRVGFGVGLDAKHYRVLTEASTKVAREEGRKSRAFPIKSFCTSRLVRLLMDHCDEVDAGAPPGTTADPLGLIFNDDRAYAMQCYSQVSDIREGFPLARQRIRAISFAQSSTYFPLQAADMLAYATCNELKKPLKRRWSKDNIFTNLLRAEDPAYGIFYRSELWDRDSDAQSMRSIVQSMRVR